MAGKTFEERIETIDKELEQLKARRKNLKAQESERKRKAETQRKIRIGGVVEKVLGKPIEGDDLAKLETFLRKQGKRGNYFSRAMESKIINSEENKNEDNYITGHVMLSNDEINDSFDVR